MRGMTIQGAQFHDWLLKPDGDVSILQVAWLSQISAQQVVR